MSGAPSLGIKRIGGEMAATKEPPFRTATEGETLSGKLAVVEQGHELTLVPWRPAIDHQLGHEFSGIVQGGSMPWPLERQRGLGL